MAKQTLSVTLEPNTIENIKKMAAAELRTVSNMIDYIVAQYMLTKKEASFSKTARASLFGQQVEITDYQKATEKLKNNLYIDNSDLEFIANIKE